MLLLGVTMVGTTFCIFAGQFSAEENANVTNDLDMVTEDGSLPCDDVTNVQQQSNSSENAKTPSPVRKKQPRTQPRYKQNENRPDRHDPKSAWLSKEQGRDMHREVTHDDTDTQSKDDNSTGDDTVQNNGKPDDVCCSGIRRSKPK